MFSITGITYIGSKPILDLFGLSTDIEPTNPSGIEGYKITNGSSAMIMDADDKVTIKKFDEDNNRWREMK